MKPNKYFISHKAVDQISDGEKMEIPFPPPLNIFIRSLLAFVRLGKEDHIRAGVK